MDDTIAAIILAGGKGTRMGQGELKVLRKISEKPIVLWVCELVSGLQIKTIICVIGHGAEQVQSTVQSQYPGIHFVIQPQQLGTADALAKALPAIPNNVDTLLVLFGDDSALYRPSTIEAFIQSHRESNSILTVLTTKKNKATSIGGLKRNEDGRLVGVLTKKELETSQISEIEILCGLFCINKQWLDEVMPLIKPSVISGEYPLPSLIAIAAQEKRYANAVVLQNELEWNSVNTPEELAEAESKKNKQNER